MNKIKAKKSLGQHFLNSKSALEKIVGSADIVPGELILEIGPGTGILTQALLDVGAKVLAIEKDGRAKELLTKKFANEISFGNLILVEGDVLDISKHDKDKLLGGHKNTNIEVGSISTGNSFEKISELLNQEKYKIVANIPYYITGAILKKFLEEGPRPTTMILLLQKEVADRIVARDGKESILSISVKAFGTPSIVAKVPRGAFVPPPNVDSAILKIKNIKNELFHELSMGDEGMNYFFEIVRAGFAQKRKLIINNLCTFYENKSRQKNVEQDKEKRGEILKRFEKIFEELKIDKKTRAEDISIENWLKLTNYFRHDKELGILHQ